MTLFEVSVMDSVSVFMHLSQLFNGDTLLSGKELDEFPHPTLLICEGERIKLHTGIRILFFSFFI